MLVMSLKPENSTRFRFKPESKLKTIYYEHIHGQLKKIFFLNFRKVNFSERSLFIFIQFHSRERSHNLKSDYKFT